jgi:hypothetical protein
MLQNLQKVKTPMQQMISWCKMIFWGKQTNYIMKMRLYCSEGADGW